MRRTIGQRRTATRTGPLRWHDGPPPRCTPTHDAPRDREPPMSHAAAWALLVVAGLFETAWAIGLKYADGFTRLGPTLFTIAALAVSMLLLAYAVRVLPIGTAYAVWVGIGALGAAALGILLFQEPLTPARAGFLLLLLVSIAGLRMTSQG